MFSFATHASGESPEEARAYSEFEKLVAERVAAVKGMPLFTTDAAPAALWNAYLSSLPMHRQQHYNCLLPGSIVQGRVQEVSKAYYSGDAFEIATRSGHRLALTANHPVLTDRGFVAAKEISPGNNLIRYRDSLEDPLSRVYDENSPTTIDDLFESLSVAGPVSTLKDISPFDLYGDGGSIQGDVYVVTPNSGLPLHRKSHRLQSSNEGFFAGPSMRELTLPGESSLMSNLLTIDPPQGSEVCRVSEGSSLLQSGEGHSENHRGSTRSDRYAGSSQAINDGAATNSKGFSDTTRSLASSVSLDDTCSFAIRENTYTQRLGHASELDVRCQQNSPHVGLRDPLLSSQLRTRFPGKVSLDEVVSVRRFHYSGPVYDMGTDVGYFVASTSIVAGGLIVSNCRACQQFIERYAGLCFINEKEGCGKEPLLWWYTHTHQIPDFFSKSHNALMEVVYEAEITGVFLSGGKTWGTPKTFDPKRDATWTHLHAANPAPYSSSLKSAEQAMAEKREDHGMLCRALAEFSTDAVRQAVRLLEAGNALDRSEKVLGVAQWLLKLRETAIGKQRQVADNLIWLAVANAPVGFCHVRSSMIGTLLEDIAAGTMDFDTIKQRWQKKMHPLQYQRPTAPPKSGAINAAEKIVESLQSAGSLNRRFARTEDILAWLWRPADAPRTAPEAQQGSGVFSHLRGLGDPVAALQMPCETMTWVKFRDTVLPTAWKLEYSVPHGTASYFGMVTAEDATSPPILQWDGLSFADDLPAHLRRNPVSWYYNVYGSPPQRWGLNAGEWRAVNGICLPPYHWQKPETYKHFGESIFFILEGMTDTTYTAGAGFFPECLRSEYHSIRSVMEAYAKRAVVSSAREGTANGLGLQKDQPWQCTLRVNGDRTYKLDRWD